MNTLTAYHGQQSEKDAVVAMMKAHRAADEIMQGSYGRFLDGKRVACLVGCATGGNHHELFPDRFGIPEQLAYLADSIFEGLPFEQAVELPVAFFEAAPTGATLSRVWPQFAIWTLTDEKHGVRQYARPDGQAAIDQVVALYRRQIAGEIVALSEWQSAAYAAYAAANAAKADAYAAYAADAAAKADAYAAYAAYAATAAYAAYATRGAFWQAARDELLRLLAAVPVVESVN